jgi:hypothetical protein
MIHTLITAISTNLPIPRILPGAITGLLIAASLFLWLKRGSRSGATMLLALAIGLGALTWGVLEGQKPAPFDYRDRSAGRVRHFAGPGLLRQPGMERAHGEKQAFGRCLLHSVSPGPDLSPE